MKKRKFDVLRVSERINRAVVGFMIPIMSIPRLYTTLEIAIVEGKPDAELAAIVASFPGVEKARC